MLFLVVLLTVSHDALQSVTSAEQGVALDLLNVVGASEIGN
jgi:hypothetical protein